MVNWEKIKIKQFLKQYKNKHVIQDDRTYRQVTISQTGEVSFRGEKHGTKIGRKRQFLIDLDNHPNTLIFIRQGVMGGGIGVCPPEVHGCVVTENMPMFDIVNINPIYLLNFIKSPIFKKEVNKLVPVGTAQKALHENKLLDIEVPYPSEKDQGKVVKKIQSMENEIKQLGENFQIDETLLTKLKQSILQEAVQGKLVPQNPKEGSASELLQKIKKEKEKLIKEGKSKKGKELPKIEEGRVPYMLPKGWVWCRLGDVCENINDGVHYAPKYIGEGVPSISAKDIYNDKVNLESCNFISEEEYNSQKNKFTLKKSSLLVTKSGSIGRTAIFKGDFDLYLVESVGVINVNNSFMDPKYIKYLLDGIFTEITYKGTHVRGLGVKHLTLTLLGNIPLPLPPFPEQKRIVVKVDKLMQSCDELGLRIKDNEKNSELLMGAVLNESF